MVDAGHPGGEYVAAPTPPRRRRIGLFGALSAVEDAFYALAGLAVLLVAVGLAVRAAHRIGGMFLASCAVVATVAATMCVLRDIRRRSWTPVSVGVAIAYGLSLAAVLAFEFTAA